jgi:hypothetical protein
MFKDKLLDHDISISSLSALTTAHLKEDEAWRKMMRLHLFDGYGKEKGPQF